MKHLTAIVLIPLLLLAGCAGKKLRHEAPALATDSTYQMDVSTAPIAPLCDDYNLAFQINFINKDGRWLRIDRAELDLSNKDQAPYNIIIGKDLRVWAQSKQDELQIDDHNEKMGFLIADVAGAILMVNGVLNHSQSSLTAGAAVTAASAGTQATKKLLKDKDSAQGVELSENTYLFEPFTIPSMGFVKRWFLVNIPKKKIASQGTLTLHTVEGETLKYRIQIAATSSHK